MDYKLRIEIKFEFNSSIRILIPYIILVLKFKRNLRARKREFDKLCAISLRAIYVYTYIDLFAI